MTEQTSMLRRHMIHDMTSPSCAREAGFGSINLIAFDRVACLLMARTRRSLRCKSRAAFWGTACGGPGAESLIDPTRTLQSALGRATIVV
jgi:hypothetical protein